LRSWRSSAQELAFGILDLVRDLDLDIENSRLNARREARRLAIDLLMKC